MESPPDSRFGISHLQAAQREGTISTGHLSGNTPQNKRTNHTILTAAYGPKSERPEATECRPFWLMAQT